MSAYKKIVVYYFSGTGNSKNVAIWLYDSAIRNNIECELINIAKIDPRNITKPDAKCLIVFVSPVHGFNYPPIMLNFLMRFPKGNNNVALMNTRAGMLIGKFITPGLSGITFYLASLILMIKGYSIKSMFPVDLPSNWISVHPGLNEKTIKYLHIKNKEKVADFANGIIAGNSNFKGLYEIIQDTLIAPISVLYYFIGRFILAKTYYASNDCNNCDSCIKSCPVNAIKNIDGRPFWTINCESCMHCMSNCPKKAIETGHGFIFVIGLIYSLFVITSFYIFLDKYFIHITNGTFRFLIENLIFFALLILGYRILHYCLRFKIIERIVVYTSLTKYKFWGKRYKALKSTYNKDTTLHSNKQ